jgi:biotin synthase-like enzyme
MSKDYDDNENDDIFRKEQVEKFYAEARPLREKYKPRELTDEELTKDTECKYCKQGCFRCDARKTLTDIEIIDAWKKFPNWGHEQHILMFGRELLKKASEK